MMQVRVIFDPALLQSEQTMAEAIYRLQSQEEHFFPQNLCSPMPAALTPGRVSLEISMEGLLQPPCIDYVKIEDDDGSPIVFISTAGDAGKVNVFVSVLDEGGNVLAHGPAFYFPRSGTEWAFAVFEPIPSGTVVRVAIHVIDCTGGARIETHRLTIP
jgi:hypothetical protein